MEIHETPASVEQLLSAGENSSAGSQRLCGGRVRAAIEARRLTMALVLVVDDEFGIVKLLEDVLTEEGHRVVIATNGRQALERAAKEKPDLVVTDFMMPIIDGAAFMKALRADSQLAEIPVVIMSSIPEAMVAERSPGYVAFVPKLFNVFAVVDLVAEPTKALDNRW
jgi:CheY-like chemotaxis protein